MFAIVFRSALFLTAVTLVSCSPAPKESLQDIPEICRFVDFSKDPEMTKICGLRETRYGGLKNIPPMRFLISPKGGHLALISGKVELRLPSTGPVELGDSATVPFDFSSLSKREFVKNGYEYFEIYPSGAERLRLFKLTFPTVDQRNLSFCFEIPSRVTDPRLKSIGGQQVNKIECEQLQTVVHADSVATGKLVVTASATPVVDTTKVLTPNQKMRSKRGGKKK